MKWFRLYGEVLHDPKVQKLSSALKWHWIELLCLASDGNPRGILPEVDDVAYKLSVTSRKAQTILDALVQRGLLDRTQIGLMPHNWPLRQPNSDNAAARMRRTRSEDVPNKFALEEEENRTEQNRTEQEAEQSAAAASLKVYEETIGQLTAHAAQLVSEAVEEYGEECVQHCLREASEQGKRSWKYANAIMKRHASEGCFRDKPPVTEDGWLDKRMLLQRAKTGMIAVEDLPPELQEVHRMHEDVRG